MNDKFDFDYRNVDETHEYRGFKFCVSYDTFAESPRDYYDSFSTMSCKHSRYSLGDDNGWDKLIDYLADEYPNKAEDIRYYWDNAEVLDFALAKIPIILLITAYEHGGITLHVCDTHGASGAGYARGWDSGAVGCIWTTKEEACKQFGWKHITKKRIETLKKYMEEEVKEYSEYIEGNVYCVKIMELSGDTIDCYGNIIGLDYAFSLIKEEIDRMANDRMNISDEKNMAAMTATFC